MAEDPADAEKATAVLPEYTDADFRRVILRALRLLGVLAAVALGPVWWKWGWRSAVLLLAGAAISGSGLWEWLRLMTAVIARMDATGVNPEVRPMGPVLVGFFLRLGLTVAVLYASLKFLEGSVMALALGLALGVVSLMIEGLRLVKTWTV